MKAEYCKGKGLFVHIVPRLSIVKDYAHNRSNDSNYFRMSWNVGYRRSRYSRLIEKRVVRWRERMFYMYIDT